MVENKIPEWAWLGIIFVIFGLIMAVALKIPQLREDIHQNFNDIEQLKFENRVLREDLSRLTGIVTGQEGKIVEIKGRIEPMNGYWVMVETEEVVQK